MEKMKKMFHHSSSTGISTTRAVSHILGRPVMGQGTAGIKGCIAIKNKEEDRRADLKKARDELGGAIREKEAALNSKKRKQVVMESLLTPRSKQSPAPVAKKLNKKHLDLAVARFFFEDRSFRKRHVVDKNAAMMAPEQWYEMYVKAWHPELAEVGMSVLSQVISASSCERNWSAHGHIHSKVRNKREPATTEKLVYVYANSKIVSETRASGELKMFAWDIKEADD